jgi:DNA polymerase-3 subunit delta'
MTVAVPHAWNTALWQRLAGGRGTLPHGLLVTGVDGLGKDALAQHMSAALLCQAPEAAVRPCGECQSCRLFYAASHPDMHVLRPEAVFRNDGSLASQYAVRYAPPRPKGRKTDSTVISVDQVRALIEGMQTHPSISAHKVALITPADALNVNAANSLLKLLEEPPSATTLILVTPRPERLPATVRSRCMRITVPTPPRREALEWLTGEEGVSAEQGGVLLDLSGGAPLLARARAKAGYLDARRGMIDDLAGLARGTLDPIGCAGRWKAMGPAGALDWLHCWLVDLIRSASSADPPRLYNPDARPALHDAGNRLNLKTLFQILEAVSEARRLLGGPLDEQLLLEDVLVQWALGHAKTSRKAPRKA